MTDLDALELFTPTPATVNVAKARCRRHVWVTFARPIGDEFPGTAPDTYPEGCVRCGVLRDPVKSRRGRSNRSRGNRIERAVAKAVGGRRTGMFGGKDDVLEDGGLFAFQVKSFASGRFPGWMTDQLDALRSARTDREPVLVVAEAPGPGRRSRRIYVVDEKTWLALHGRTEP